MAAAIYGDTAPHTQQVVSSTTCLRSSSSAFCGAHPPQCRPPAPPGSNSHSLCINASSPRYAQRTDSYRPEQLGEGPGLGTLTFYGMPQPRLKTADDAAPIRCSNASSGWGWNVSCPAQSLGCVPRKIGSPRNGFPWSCKMPSRSPRGLHELCSTGAPFPLSTSKKNV